MYGIESIGKGPSDIFDEKDAEDALDKARYVLSISKRLVDEIARD